eukprot:3633961-Rhodomonas_salina.1
MAATHVALVFADCGNFYSRFTFPARCCKQPGRKHSVRSELAVCSADAGDALCFELCSSAELWVQACGCAVSVPVPTTVQRVVAVEVWLAEGENAGCKPASAPVMQNVCGRLQAQNLGHLCDVDGLARRINKCFGRKYCVFTLHGNVSFDKKLCYPQFRGVKDLARFRATLGAMRICGDEMLVHLLVLSANVGHSIV